MNEKSMKMAESFLKRAWNKLNEAREYLKEWKFSESISASQECIELSIKAIYLLLCGKYPKGHKFKEEDFETILENIPEELKYLEIHKLYLYSKFWAEFYTIAKYGLERVGVGADKLFEEEEARLALKHAEKCHLAASSIKTYIQYHSARE